jgi:signal transduction histidine kinase
MKRWGLDSIAFTIGLTIIVAMGLGFTLRPLVNEALNPVGFAWWKNPRRYDFRFYLTLLPAKVVSLVDTLDALPTAQQEAMITAAQRPEIKVSLLETPLPNLVNSNDRIAQAVRRHIRRLFGVHHQIVTVPRSELQNDPADGKHRPTQGLLVETPLRDGHWLLFTTNVPTPFTDPGAEEYSRAALVGRAAFAVVLVLLLSLLTARRLANPLSQLSLAVERLGATGDAPLLPLKGPREIRMMIGAFNRMQERLRRFNEDRMQMLAAISHDMRTSLTRLKLRLEVGGNGEQQQKMIAELDAMSAMMVSILSFARDDAKREPRALIDLGSVVEGVCEDAADAGAAVSYSGEPGVTVSGRQIALRRAVSNLVDNAVKYAGGAEVTLTKEAGQIVVAVEDRGPGIPRSEREKVFEPFYRIESSRNPDTGGVGLGLSVARSIAREHGGDIVLATRKGGGLTARLDLPT